MYAKRNRIVFFLLGMVCLSELILHFLPLRILDTVLLQLSIVICLFQAILLYFVGRSVYAKNSWKTNLLILLPFVLCVMNFLVYYARIGVAFSPEKTGETTGTVVRIYRKGGGRSPERHYVEFKYTILDESFQHAHELEKSNRAGIKSGDPVEVVYNLRDPALSRLKVSLPHLER